MERNEGDDSYEDLDKHEPIDSDDAAAVAVVDSISKRMLLLFS